VTDDKKQDLEPELELAAGPLQEFDPDTATVTWDDGSKETFALRSGGGEALELRERNRGNSDRWGKSGTPGPRFVSRVTVTAPGRTILSGADAFGYIFGGNDSWLICDAATGYCYPAKRGDQNSPTIAGYEKSLDFHTFDGGDLIGYVRLVPEDDPIEQRFLASAITAKSAELAKRIIAFDEDLISRWPWLERFVSRWTLDVTSMSSSTPNQSRNFGWFLRPENFMARYPAHPGGLASIKHHMGLGTKIPGGTCNNEHEGHVLWYLAQSMRKNDLPAFHTAIGLARAAAAYGTILSNQNDLWYGLTRNENGNKMRGTAGMAPSTGKMWMEGLIALDALLNHEDPLLAETVAEQGAAMKGNRYTLSYHDGGGTRLLSHLLMTLRAHWLASGDEGYRAKAVSEITGAFTRSTGVGSKLYWPNLNTKSGNEMTYEEGLSGIVAWWIEQAPGALGQFLPALRGIVEHTLTHVVRWDGCVGYKWNPTDAPGSYNNEIVHRPLAPLEVTYNGSFNGAWLLALRPWCEREWPGRFGALFDSIERFMFTRYHGWDDFDATEGTSSEKIAGFIAQGCQSWFGTDLAG